MFPPLFSFSSSFNHFLLLFLFLLLHINISVASKSQSSVKLSFCIVHLAHDSCLILYLHSSQFLLFSFTASTISINILGIHTVSFSRKNVHYMQNVLRLYFQTWGGIVSFHRGRKRPRRKFGVLESYQNSQYTVPQLIEAGGEGGGTLGWECVLQSNSKPYKWEERMGQMERTTYDPVKGDDKYDI